MFHQDTSVTDHGVDATAIGGIDQVGDGVEVGGEGRLLQIDQTEIRLVPRFNAPCLEAQHLSSLRGGCPINIVRLDSFGILPLYFTQKRSQLHGLYHIQIV